MAESVSPEALDTYKGLHFPSTDIPQANRQIFMTMRSRMIADVVGWCRLTLSKPVLKAPMVSALETTMC